MILISELLKIITTCIGPQFPELGEQVDWTESLITKMSFVDPVINIEMELSEIWEQINSIKTSLG
jgi:hypothetical protein